MGHRVQGLQGMRDRVRILSFKPTGNVLSELCIFLMLRDSWAGRYFSSA